MIEAIFFDDNSIRNEIIKLALDQLDKPYIHDTYGPDSFDCAGFVSYIFGEIFDINIFEEGFGLSTTTKIMTGKWGKIEIYNEEDNPDYKLSNIRPGDVLLFHTQSLKDYEPKIDNRYPGHCGIYLGDNEFIHCSSMMKKVVFDTFEAKRWQKKLVASKDMITNNKIKKNIKL